MPDWTKDPAGWIKWMGGLGKECLRDAGRFDECTPFWGAIGALLGILCLLGLLLIAAHFLRQRAAANRAWRRRLAESEIASPEVMAEHQWSGDNLVDPDLSKEEIVRRIEEARVRKRLENEASPTSEKGDKALGIDILHR